MASSTILLSNANNFLPSLPSTSSSPFLPNSPYQVTRKRQIVCKAAADEESSIVLKSPPWSRRGISVTVVAATTLLFGYRGRSEADAAILEAEDDQGLLDKVKNDRKKRLERQGVINSSDNETALLQDLIYKLSKVGQAIEKEDISVASKILGPGIDTNWVQKVNFALNQLSSTGEEKVEIDNFNINLASLIASVDKNDIPTAKESFVAVANAFKKWTTLTGLAQKLKGL
ncbi:thylakoid lumenal 16.5 kDa protein, chloroplastic [Primulina tabacum]|uniref:thylakoid lumenal 16.5 kDa protein, chloroplastic n=1 Tax=Primulina tabacum TaxID=48773 RepID=UPI003F5A7DB3